MNIQITIATDATNYRCMAQLSHIMAQLSLCRRVGPYPYILSLYPPLKSKSQNGF